MTTDVFCWHCGKVLQNLILPLSRREECASCAADQHVCKMCGHFEADTTTQCSEERAEPPGNKEAANFCDYFLLGTARVDAEAGQEDARQQLMELFGDAPEEAAKQKPLESEAVSEFDPEAELKKLFDS